ncbi:unnamed protein product [Cuscuta campestris]|uniref:Uncharacterized protein n=1 Tax=Cuscuta campestris TaxID=132261 RepID=A0A484NEG4_9ASTE|nr:unnamed protein product [Cuscuta campestris]
MKTCWSEDEERLLVELHEQLGNRWSEIARRIPGRSENAVKNHWNAAKRRQFSKRRESEVGSSSSSHTANKRRPLALQNFMKYKYFSGLTLGSPGSVFDVRENPPVQRQGITTANPLHRGSLSSVLFPVENEHRDSPPSLLAETCDEEMSFMAKLFGSSPSSSGTSMKTCWSEDGERLLVELHEQLGNRWSEIARRIPGRSENGIKNHWNAAKRRQFSKRREREVGSSSSSSHIANKRRPLALQNYIKYKYFSGLTLGLPGSVFDVRENPPVQRQGITTANPLHRGSLSSVLFLVENEHRDSPPSLLAETCDEEMSFMAKLFGSSPSSSGTSMVAK